MSSLHNVGFTGAMLSLMMLAGCSEAPPDPASFVAAANPTNVHRVTNLYQQFTRTFRGRGPKNKKVFQEFIARLDPAYLERMGVEPASLDLLFVGDRDGQPLQIAYAKSKPIIRQASLNGGAESASQVERQRVAVVREAIGGDGTVRIGFLGSRAGVEEVPTAEAPGLN